jgi:Cys-rich four helix bundle protein (predicted Tat secretion target)
MKRREWLGKIKHVGTAAAGVLLVSEALRPKGVFAQSPPKETNTTPSAPTSKKKKKLSKINASSPAFVELLESLEECADACGRCYAFCISSITPDNTMLLGCLKTLSELIPVCDATLKLARLESAQTLDLVKACGKLCGKCAEECKKHKEHHAVCADCMESCLRTQKACKAVEG